MAFDTLRKAGKCFRGAVGFEQLWRPSPKAGRGMGMPPRWRLVGAIILYHRDPPLGLIATGKPSPLTETAISVDRSSVYWLGWDLRLFPTTVATRPVMSFESPPGKAGFRVSGLITAGRRPSPVRSVAGQPD